MLDDIRLTNMLSDYKAFEELPAVRYLVKTCLSEGMMQRVISAYSADDPLTELQNFQNDVLNLGYRDNVTDFFIQSLECAFGLKSEVQIDKDEKAINKPSKKSSIVSIANDGKHLSFKGIPIYGEPDVVVASLEKIGYEILHPYNYHDHIGVLQGTFAGINGCSIIVGGTASSDLVYSIAVLFPEQNNWYNLKDQYMAYKDKLKKKYGKPISGEYFDEPYYEGDGYELSALSNGSCHYASVVSYSN